VQSTRHKSDKMATDPPNKDMATEKGVKRPYLESTRQRYDDMFNDLMHSRLHEPQTPETRTRILKMMHTNMRTVVVIEHVQHDQDKETTIIIFEEDIHDLQKNKHSPSRKNLISISTTLPQ
jgi:hypothetical protein